MGSLIIEGIRENYIDQQSWDVLADDNIFLIGS